MVINFCPIPDFSLHSRNQSDSRWEPSVFWEFSDKTVINLPTSAAKAFLVAEGVAPEQGHQPYRKVIHNLWITRFWSLRQHPANRTATQGEVI